MANSACRQDAESPWLTSAILYIEALEEFERESSIDDGGR
jgi:hypothetical protein